MAGIMCEYFSIFCHSIMPPPVHCPNLKGVKIMKARISRKFFCLLLTVVMACTLLPITALAAEPSGSIESAGITHAGGYLKNAVSVELKDVTFAESVAVKLYSGDTLLTTATLQGVNPGSHGFLTCCIATETADEYWALTPWTPRDNVVPNKAVLVVDGHEQDTKNFTLDANEWAALPGTVLPCSIERVGITRDNGKLKNAVSVDLKNVNFESSVRVELYSDATLLTTATLNTDKLGAGSYPYLTCCIATQTADEYWSLTSWTPKDDVVPNKAVLVVDGHEQDTNNFTLDADEWAALPGTAFPYSGSIERAGITHANNGGLKNAVSVDLKNVNFESSVRVELYSDATLLTTATLNTDKLGAGSYPYLTCCIATQTADEYWSLTSWTPKDDVVPNKAVLVVDGHEQDTNNFTLDADEWAALPGTAFPYSGSTGTGVTTYSITVKSSKNGDVTASHKTASKGTAVTLTVDPDKGYVLDTLTVLDGKDKEIKLTEKNGKYTFTMPASKVNVEAMFKAAGNNPFTDVPAGSYYEDAVIWAVGKGITSGTSAVTFDPNGNCTRAQAVTFLWRAAGSPAAKSKVMPFTDVPSGSYYYDAVLWAMEQGITKGTSDTAFSPDATCTRAQIVTFLWRANGSPVVSGNSAFTDVAADAYYAAAVTWAEKNGVTGGIGGGLFGSNNNCTRAQIVTFLYRSVK